MYYGVHLVLALVTIKVAFNVESDLSNVCLGQLKICSISIQISMLACLMTHFGCSSPLTLYMIIRSLLTNTKEVETWQKISFLKSQLKGKKQRKGLVE
jgi:hypothetical protein